MIPTSHQTISNMMPFLTKLSFFGMKKCSLPFPSTPMIGESPQMKLNKFFNLENHYTVEKGTPEGPKVRAAPSEYLNNLHPDQAIEELKAHIESLQGELGKYTAEDMENANISATERTLKLQLKIAQTYLTHPTKSLKDMG